MDSEKLEKHSKEFPSFSGGGSEGGTQNIHPMITSKTKLNLPSLLGHTTTTTTSWSCHPGCAASAQVGSAQTPPQGHPPLTSQKHPVARELGVQQAGPTFPLSLTLRGRLSHTTGSPLLTHCGRQELAGEGKEASGSQSHSAGHGDSDAGSHAPTLPWRRLCGPGPDTGGHQMTPE